MKTQGITFKPSALVVLGVQEDNLWPQFGEILEVYVVGLNRVILYIRTFKTVEYIHHYHAYGISRTADYKLISPEDLYSHSLLYLHHLRTDSCTKLVVVTKYTIL